MPAQAVTPPVIQSAIPTAKEKKYDRQLRLWAASGQQALENARILLLNQNPGVVGIEALKNLVLPGVGSFTIVDGVKVCEPDLGLNFFLEESSLGKSRASETAAFLKELNPEVEFHPVEQHILDYLQNSGTELQKFTLILLIGPSKEAPNIRKIATEYSIPLFYVHSVGFYSHFSVQIPKLFPIVDTHPDPASTQDLRLLNPWSELASFQNKMAGNLSQLDDHAHGHVPYLLLLLHFLEEWKGTHDGKPPSTYSEKKDFKTLVDAGARTSNPEGGEENFAEASGAVLKSLNPPSISSGLREIFHETSCFPLTSESPNFWWIANGIRDFYEKNNGLLPLPGTLPDMKAQSADYVALQTIYKNKAIADIAEVFANIQAGAQNSNVPQPAIPQSEIAEFCKNAAHVKLIRGLPLHLWLDDPASAWNGREAYFVQSLQEESSLLPIHIALQAYDSFLASSSISTPTIPLVDRDEEAAMKAMSQYCTVILDKLLKAGGADEETAEAAKKRMGDVLREVCRGFGTELHNISALTGGIVAQEVIKVITKQYVPVDNTCVFDGVQSKTAVFRMG